MKVLAFADVHGYEKALQSLKNKAKRSKPNLIICAGDFTLFEHNIEKILKKINSFGRKILVIHGNHESSSRVKSLCKKFKNITFFDKRLVPFEDFLVFGWGGGGFAFKDKEFEQFVKKNKNKLKNKKIIFITHAPPYNTKLDFLDYTKSHVGNKSFTEFIKKNKNVVLVISGHLHENEGKKDKINQAVLANPGIYGRIYRI